MRDTTAPRLLIDRRRLLLWGGALCAGAATPGLASCGGKERTNQLERIRDRGVLRVAIANEAPYGFIDADGSLKGAFPDIVGTVADQLRLGVVEGVVVPFDSLIDTLAANRADVVAAGMTVTAARCERMTFGRPELRSLTALAVRVDDDHDLSDLASVVASDAVLGVLAGAIEVDDATAAGVPADRLVTFDAVTEMVPSLLGGDIDAIALTARSVRELVDDTASGTLRALPGFAPTIAGRTIERVAALAYPADDHSLLDAFELTIEPLRHDGTIAAIFERYGWEGDDLPPGGQPLACET